MNEHLHAALGKSPDRMTCRIDAILCPDILPPMNRTTHFVAARIALWLNFVLMAVSAPPLFGQGASIVSPELHKDGSVTFRLNQPGAHEVLVALAGLETPLKMSQTQGIWSVTSAPLESGTYWYSYVVAVMDLVRDGRSISGAQPKAHRAAQRKGICSEGSGDAGCTHLASVGPQPGRLCAALILTR